MKLSQIIPDDKYPVTAEAYYPGNKETALVKDRKALKSFLDAHYAKGAFWIVVSYEEPLYEDETLRVERTVFVSFSYPENEDKAETKEGKAWTGKR